MKLLKPTKENTLKSQIIKLFKENKNLLDKDVLSDLIKKGENKHLNVLPENFGTNADIE